jgi:hypothetical protein
MAGKSEPMRLTDYHAVRKFMDSYNKSASPAKESGIRDVLDRLTKMTLQSNIPDPNRVDQFRSNQVSQTKSSPSSLKQTDLSIDKTRMYAAQARTSLMTFAHCQTRHLREKAMDILIEALETNTLSYAASETENLFQILDVARLALESIVNSAGNQPADDASSSESDGRLFVDLEMERVFKCIDLIMQRIEFICDMDALILLPTQAYTLNILKEELGLFKTDDPSVVQLISTFHDSVS